MTPGWITVTGSNIQNSSGVSLSAGTIAFAPVDSNGAPVSFRAGDSTHGQVTQVPVSTPVVNGGFSILLPDVYLTNPQNVAFAVTVSDAQGNPILGNPQFGPTGYGFFQPSSDTTAPSSGNPRGGPGYGLYDPTSGSINFDLFNPAYPAFPTQNI